MTMLNMTHIAARIRSYGFPVVVEHTGGNTATIYAGTATFDSAEDRDRYQVAAGPGYFESPALALAWVDEFSVGPDAGDDDAPVDYRMPETDEEAVEAILSLLRLAASEA